MRAEPDSLEEGGRDSFEEEDSGIPIPVTNLGSTFDHVAMAPPPPRALKGSGASGGGADNSSADSLKVFCRMRPLGARETGGVLELLDEQTVRSLPLPSVTRHASRASARDFGFTRVFGCEAGQEEVYAACAAPLVDAVLTGRPALLFTYGVTNAGKSFTMMGREGEDRGVMPRALEAALERARRGCGSVCVSFLEIYNEQIFDLMDKTTQQTQDRGPVFVF